MPRYFTLPEAQALVPQVEGYLRQAVSSKTSLAEAVGELQGESERIRLTGGAQVDQGKLIETMSRRDAAAVQLRDALAAIQEHGCVVKDLDMGLLDFPALYRGEEVCLCWKLGEPEIRFWHRPEEGYRGRKPIDREFLDDSRGSA
jgi:hypothetical protein